MTDRRRAHREGRLHVHARFPSKFLSTRRDLIVYVPPGYAQAKTRHPVLYLQDGQNLFDPATAFGGQDWRADITADEMVERGEIEPPILVGIYNTGERRISEYTPTRDNRRRRGGKADRYAEMLVREIKPFVDHEYRTLKAATHTAVGGSSLGGLVSLIAVLEYPRVFGRGAILSPSVWWDNRSVLRIIERYRSKLRPSLWLDVGTCEGDSPAQIVDDLRALRQTLVARGWRDPETLAYYEIQGGTHSEAAWSARFGAVLAWLFPKRKGVELQAELQATKSAALSSR
ncbi:MAG: alpha/beta hydrolase [Acidobacteriaceae bacterium]|nr:alpha/beta hydrolase [Acidobacteriaceae bacterium]